MYTDHMPSAYLRSIRRTIKRMKFLKEKNEYPPKRPTPRQLKASPESMEDIAPHVGEIPMAPVVGEITPVTSMVVGEIQMVKEEVQSAGVVVQVSTITVTQIQNDINKT